MDKTPVTIFDHLRVIQMDKKNIDIDTNTYSDGQTYTMGGLCPSESWLAAAATPKQVMTGAA